MKRTFLTMIFLSLFLVGCKPDSELPTVVTQELSEITDNSVKISYEVTADGGAEVTSSGVCWSTSQNPTIDDDKTNDGSGIGKFTSQLQDLLPSTTYYVRSYAVNSVGVSYGEKMGFVTLAEDNNDDDNGGDDNGGDDNGGDDNGGDDNGGDDNGGDDNGGDDNGEAEILDVTVNGVTFNMILVKSGTFYMGAQKDDPNAPNYDEEAWSREAPVHQVTLSDYYIAEAEVTQELWTAVMGSNPSHFEGGQRPVEQTTWYDCQNFINALNQLTGLNFRFPTEAEWEFAARGGNESHGYKYSGSDNIDEIAWYSADGKKTSDVMTKLPNELGIYDMSGNVMEWCSDAFGDYSSEHQIDPTGPNGVDRVVRGGCCLSAATYCRIALRNFLHPGGTSYGIGMRLALTL